MKKVEIFQNCFKDPADREVLSALCKSWYAHYVKSHVADNIQVELYKQDAVEVTITTFTKYFGISVKFDTTNYPDKITFYDPVTLNCFRIDGFTGRVIEE